MKSLDGLPRRVAPPALAYSEGQMLYTVLLLGMAIGDVNNKRRVGQILCNGGSGLGCLKAER